MHENEQVIPEIVVLPFKTQPKWYKKGKKIPGYSEFQNLGEGAGIVLDMKNRFVLDKVKFEVKECTYDSVLVRINIWRFEEKSALTEKSLLTNQIYQIVKKSKSNIEYVINIEESNIHDKSKILVSLECVHYFGNGYIWFPVNLGKGYTQDISLANWEKMSFNIGISLKVTKKLFKNKPE